MSLAGGLVFECDVDGTRRRDLNRDRIVRFLRKAPETRLSRSGPQAVVGDRLDGFSLPAPPDLANSWLAALSYSSG